VERFKDSGIRLQQIPTDLLHNANHLICWDVHSKARAQPAFAGKETAT